MILTQNKNTTNTRVIQKLQSKSLNS